MVCSLAGNRWFSAPTRALGPLAVRAASYPCQGPRAPEDRALALPVRLPWRHRWRSPEATQDAQSLVGKREGCPAARRMLQMRRLHARSAGNYLLQGVAEHEMAKNGRAQGAST